MTEKEKMLAGDLYNPDDPELVRARRRARELTKGLNDTAEEPVEKRERLIAQLVGSAGVGVRIQPPFYCDYGFNIHLGDSVFFNFNCVVLDTARIKIGDHVMIGPNVQIYAPIHPMNADERRTWLEASKPVTIGCLDWWWRDHLSRCHDRGSRGRRCRQHRHARYPSQRVRGW